MDDNNSVRLELGEDEITTENVDSVRALRAASEYFSLLSVSATDDGGEPLPLRGLRIMNKCTAFATSTDDAPRARRALRTSSRWTSGKDAPPPKYRKDVERWQKTLRSLPYSVRTTFANETVVLSAPAVVVKPELAQLEVIDTLRAELIEVGGESPTAEFKSPTEPDIFCLKLTKAQAHHLAAHLYEEVELRAQIRRDESEKIVAGELLGFDALPECVPKDVISAWREYHKQVASEWDGIDDVEGFKRREDEDP